MSRLIPSYAMMSVFVDRLECADFKLPRRKRDRLEMEDLEDGTDEGRGMMIEEIVLLLKSYACCNLGGVNFALDIVNRYVEHRAYVLLVLNTSLSF